jgi:hypothetical protein
MHKALFMKTKNDLAALRNKMRNRIYAAASIGKKVMVREDEMRRHSLLTSPFGMNRSKSVPLFPKLDAAKALLLDNKKNPGFWIKQNFYHLGVI